MGADQNAMALLVDFSKWRVRPAIGELSRSYHFSSPQATDKTVSLTLACRLEKSVGDYFVHSILTLHLKPLRLQKETSFTMGLVTVDQSEGGVFQVRAYPMEGKRDTALLAIECAQGVDASLNAISSGKEILFTLGNQTGPYVKLVLPNDREFQQLYNETNNRMMRGSNASIGYFYYKIILRRIYAMLDLSRIGQHHLAAISKNGRRLLTNPVLNKVARVKVVKIGLTPLYFRLQKISGAAVERLWARMATFAQSARRIYLHKKRPLRDVDTFFALSKFRQRSFEAILRDRRQGLTKASSEAFTRVKTVCFVLIREILLAKIDTLIKQMKAQTWARVFVRAKDSSDKHLLQEFDTLFHATTKNQSTSPRFRSPFDKIRQAKINRDWVMFAASLIAGFVVIAALFGSSNIRTTTNLNSTSNSELSPGSSDLTTASVKLATATPAPDGSRLASATNEPPTSANEKLPTTAQMPTLVQAPTMTRERMPASAQALTPALVQTHQISYAIGDVGTLKQNFVGCRESWQDDGSLRLESRLGANDCNIRLPAGTKVIVAHIRDNADICLRSSESIICYWGTVDALNRPKQTTFTPTESGIAKPKVAKIHAAIRPQEEDERLKFLFNR
jgi:hypothetical protein